jgi:hypothetical protein
VVEIEGDLFLLFVDSVYLQAPFPPNHIGIYQIATIDYLQYSRVITNREVEMINTMKTVFPSLYRKSSISASTFPSNVTLHFLSRNTKAALRSSQERPIFGTIV